MERGHALSVGHRRPLSRITIVLLAVALTAVVIAGVALRAQPTPTADPGTKPEQVVDPTTTDPVVSPVTPTESTPPPPPEGYPILPKGWEWRSYSVDGVDGYDAVGHLEAPRSPYKGVVCNGYTAMGAGVIIDNLGGRGGKGVVIAILGSTVAPLEVGRSIEVAQGGLLPWVEGKDVCIRFPLGATEEEMKEVLNWLLGNE